VVSETILTHQDEGMNSSVEIYRTHGMKSSCFEKFFPMEGVRPQKSQSFFWRSSSEFIAKKTGLRLRSHAALYLFQKGSLSLAVCSMISLSRLCYFGVFLEILLAFGEWFVYLLNVCLVRGCFVFPLSGGLFLCVRSSFRL